MTHGLQDHHPADPGARTDGNRPRRCLVSGATGDRARMLRFVLGPDMRIVPDIRERLGGRGLWLSAERDIIDRASAGGAFARAARGRVSAPADLADEVEALLRRRCLELIGLARRAGQAVGGFEKVRAWLKSGKAGLVLAARDGARDGRAKIKAVTPSGVPLIELFGAAELGAAVGRDRLVHGALAHGKLARALRRDAERLAGVAADGASVES